MKTTTVYMISLMISVVLPWSLPFAVEITRPGGEKQPPEYTSAEPEGIRHNVDEDFAGATWIDAADVNGDGYPDIVGSAWQNAEIAWWENDGTGGNWKKHPVSTGFIGAITVAAADVDNDGFVDIVGAAKMAGDVAWWRNDSGDGTSWTRYDVATDVSGLFSLAAADLDRDGNPDILAQSTDDPSKGVIWWANKDGSGRNWVEHVVNDDLPGVRFTRAADMDRDGDTDIIAVAFHQKGRKILWYENDGSGTEWTEHTMVDSPEYNCFNAAPADVDGDADPDMVATNNRKGNYVIWFENDGDGWETHVVDGEFEAPYVVSSADMDGDGDTDVMGTSNSWDTVVWWENTDGTGDTWERHLLDVSFEKARNPIAADFDGDGDPDIAAAAFAGTVAWWAIR
jgi:hypothetical protein